MTDQRPRFAPPLPPHILEHRRQKPVKVADQAPRNLNGRIALLVTNAVGTMWCAYAFAGLALIALPQAISGGTLSIVQWISQTFLQLVLLSVIMVGQNLQGAAADKRAEETWKDADATFHTAESIQAHLDTQDAHLASQDERLAQIIAALGTAFPAGAADLPDVHP
ncbi:MAG TPA: hypothetical protein VF221_03185 [Chloroflexota bacterium]